jgi:ABC-2 type transport system ATP-binding protein
MIVLQDVVRTFGDVRALDGVSLEVGRGEVIGLLGHNGAGKTTTVRLMVGLLAPTSGSVSVDGQDPVADGVAVRRRVGVLPAAPPVDDRLTGRANLRFAADLHGVATQDVARRVDAALDAFGLGGAAGERAGTYSTGMRQRLSLARVLLTDPDVLLLDEPTSALDPMAARQVRRTIGELSSERGRTVVLCTHDLVEAQLLCDRVAVLERGRIVALGTPAELAREVSGSAVEIEVAPGEEGPVLAIGRQHGDTVEMLGPGRVRMQGIERMHVPVLVSEIVEAGIAVFAVEPREPTLEEVYVALHERSPR